MGLSWVYHRLIMGLSMLFRFLDPYQNKFTGLIVILNKTLHLGSLKSICMPAQKEDT